jgi:hypothetical protein
MNVGLPKYMNIGDFCKYTGFSRYQFMRLADKAGIRLRDLTGDVRSKMVDVQEALSAIDNLPDGDKEMPVNLRGARRSANFESPTETEEPAQETESPAAA